jgi:hypothetical protein
MKYVLNSGEAKQFELNEIIALQNSAWFAPEPQKQAAPVETPAPVILPELKIPVFVKRKPGRPRKK